MSGILKLICAIFVLVVLIYHILFTLTVVIVKLQNVAHVA